MGTNIVDDMNREVRENEMIIGFGQYEVVNSRKEMFNSKMLMMYGSDGYTEYFY